QRPADQRAGAGVDRGRARPAPRGDPARALRAGRADGDRRGTRRRGGSGRRHRRRRAALTLGPALAESVRMPRAPLESGGGSADDGRTTARFGVTMVTVVRNGAATLERTIQSVLAQRGTDLDYLIVDGDSTDGTRDVIRRYQGRLRWLSEPDRGLYDAMNK